LSDDATLPSPTDGVESVVATIVAKAAAGDVDAIFRMGQLFDVPAKGSMPVDLPKAREWYEKASHLGHSQAQYMLGNMYDYGDGGTQDDQMARHWYELAARQGVRDAQMHYARMLEIGRGGHQSKDEASQWYEKAVEQGDELAASNLGAMHFRGELTPSSDESALHYFEFAADRLDGLAHYYLSEMYLHGRAVEQHGGMALLHVCIASLVLAPGRNRQAAIARKEEILRQFPELRDRMDEAAKAYVAKKGGSLPS